MIIFGNNGIFDERAFKTFGLHAKESENSIGFFGTGLKYAIAVCIRNKRDIFINANGKQYEFTTKASRFRDKEFQAIYCNGEELPYTTELGKHWEVWQAYRELASNAMDEGGGAGVRGSIEVHAELDDINHDDVFFNRVNEPHLSMGDYFGDKTLLYKGRSDRAYVRGVRAYDTRSLFTYNLLHADLTEDRTLKSGYHLQWGAEKAIEKLTDRQAIRDVLLRSKGLFEEGLDLDVGSLSETFVEEALRLSKQNCWKHSVVQRIRAYNREKCKPTAIEPTALQQATIDKATKFLEDAGYKISDYPVCVSDDLGQGVLGQAMLADGEIWIASQCVDSGMKETASCLLEEFAHLHTGYGDETRELQTWLFDQVIILCSKFNGEVI